MKWSNVPEYQGFIEATANANYALARECLKKCLVIGQSENDAAASITILWALGETEARAGERKMGLRWLEEAERLAPDWLLPQLITAKFLAKEMADYGAATAKLNNVETTLGGSTWERREDDISRESYEERIQEVRALLGGSDS